MIKIRQVLSHIRSNGLGPMFKVNLGELVIREFMCVTLGNKKEEKKIKINKQKSISPNRLGRHTSSKIAF